MKEKVIIKTDNFCTRPVLFDTFTRKMGADFLELGIRSLSPEEFDPVAFWEGMAWDNPLSLRTMHKRVLQLPGGSNCELDLDKGQISCRRYEYFNEPQNQCCTEELIKKLDQALQAVAHNIWLAAGPAKNILLPLSGGIDSRLIACYLAAAGDPKRIMAVTFAFSRDSFEYKFAALVCEALGIKNHHFHPLERLTYRKSIDDFWRSYLGGLSVMHGHLYTYLLSVRPSNSLLVSGFIADAIGGFASESKRHFPSVIEDSKNYQNFLKLKNFFGLDGAIVHEIRNDLESIWQEWERHHAGIGFDEYVFITQRQIKTYMPLMQMYRKFCPVALPFADPFIVRLFLSAPYELRKDKHLIQLLISRRSLQVSRIGNVSSSPVLSTMRDRMIHLRRLLSCRSATALTRITDDGCRRVSSFSTEDVFGAMRVEFLPFVRKILDRLCSLGILRTEQYRLLARKPAQACDVFRSARVLSLAPGVLKSEEMDLTA